MLKTVRLELFIIAYCSLLLLLKLLLVELEIFEFLPNTEWMRSYQSRFISHQTHPKHFNLSYKIQCRDLCLCRYERFFLQNAFDCLLEFPSENDCSDSKLTDLRNQRQFLSRLARQKSIEVDVLNTDLLAPMLIDLMITISSTEHTVIICECSRHQFHAKQLKFQCKRHCLAIRF